jgi:hypothetical protein
MSRIRGLHWAARAVAAAFALVSVLPLLSNDAAATATSVRRVTLPANLGFLGFAVSQSGVGVVGTTQAGGGIAGDCDLAPLTTDPFGIGQTTLQSCADPALWGEPVAEFQTLLLPSYDQELHAARRVDGAVQLGPVLATYQADSGSHPVSAYGAGSLWIYEEQGPGGPTLFRISLATGVLQAAVRTPGLTRPFLVADDDGAWLIPAGSFGAVSDAAIYHLAVGSHAVVPVLILPGYAELGYAVWAVATSHAVYADLCIRPVNPSACTLYGLSGPSARPMFHRPSPVGPTANVSAFGGPAGVYVLEEPHMPAPGSLQLDDWLVERVNTSTGAISTVATVTLPEFWNGPDGTQQPDAVVADDTLFLLAGTGGSGAAYLEEVRW